MIILLLISYMSLFEKIQIFIKNLQLYGLSSKSVYQFINLMDEYYRWLSSSNKKNDNVKTSILIGISTLFCFLSGMMGITMKYVIDKNIFFLNLINPASMITDGFYSLYYYKTLDRYYFDIISLIIFISIMLIISIRNLRRQKYDSI